MYDYSVVFNWKSLVVNILTWGTCGDASLLPR